MGNYINGYSYPIIEIRDRTDDSIVSRLSLDLCNEGGLTEAYEEDFKRNKLESGGLVDFDFKGSRIIFTLDYSEYARKTNLFNIENIFAYNAQPLSYRIVLYPRADVMSRSFEVRLHTGNYNLGIMKGGAYALGNRLPIVEFITTNPVSKNFADPDTLAIPRRYF